MYCLFNHDQYNKLYLQVQIKRFVFVLIYQYKRILDIFLLTRLTIITLSYMILSTYASTNVFQLFISLSEKSKLYIYIYICNSDSDKKDIEFFNLYLYKLKVKTVKFHLILKCIRYLCSSFETTYW